MNKPVFLIKIEGESISCLGSQLMDILTTISPYAEKISWYAADVEINGDNPFKLGLQGYSPHQLGDTNSLINLCKQVDQFISGVFYQAKSKEGLFEYEISTEDEEFREIPNAMLEIRAFDTTYFEVYTSNSEVVEALKSRYNKKKIESDNSKKNTIHLIIDKSIMVDLEIKHKTSKNVADSKHIIRSGKATKLSAPKDISEIPE